MNRLLSFLTLLVLPALALAQPIVIGHSTIQSGALVSLAAGPSQGIKALIDSVNNAGGVAGRPLQLLSLDDGYQQDRAAANVAQAVNQGALAILMPIGTVPSMGAVRASNELRIPLVGPYTGAAPVRQHTPWAFMVRAGFQEEYEFIVRHLLTLGITDIAFVHNDNPGARGAMELTARVLESLGHKLRASVAVRDDAKDAQERARALARIDPKAIVLSVSNNVAAEFVPAYRTAGGRSQFYSFSFLNGRELQQRIGASASGIVISQVMPSPWSIALPLVRDYQQAMRRIGYTEFGYDSFEGYLNARLLVEALRATGGLPTRQSVRQALESMRSHDLGGFRVTFTPDNHHGSKFIDLTMLGSDGRYLR